MKPLNYIFFIFTIYSCTLYSPAAFSDETKEFTIKAAFMVKLTHFIQWPVPSSRNLDKPKFTICINHSHELNDSLNEWAQSGLIKNKPVSIKYLEYDTHQLSSCNILYIANNKKLSFLLNQAKKYHILTISDISGNAKRGVLINFFKEKEKLRFEINLDAAQESGFIISPRILKLATIVNNKEME